jgi:hypothetical protein
MNAPTVVESVTSAAPQQLSRTARFGILSAQTSPPPRVKVPSRPIILTCGLLGPGKGIEKDTDALASALRTVIRRPRLAGTMAAEARGPVASMSVRPAEPPSMVKRVGVTAPPRHPRRTDAGFRFG